MVWDKLQFVIRTMKDGVCALTKIGINDIGKYKLQTQFLISLSGNSLPTDSELHKGRNRRGVPLFQCWPKSMSCPGKGFSKVCRPEDYRSFLVLTVSLSCFSYGLNSSLTLCTLDNEQFTLNSQGSTPAIFSPAILWSLQFLTSVSPLCLSYLASPYSSLKSPPIMYISILT